MNIQDMSNMSNMQSIENYESYCCTSNGCVKANTCPNGTLKNL